MKKHVLTLSLLATACFAGTAAAEAPQAMPDPYADPVAAHEARVGIHRLMAAYLVEAGKMVEGKGYEDAGQPVPEGAKPFSGLRMHRIGDFMVDLSYMYEDFMFVPGSFEGTAAKPEILENQVDFQEHVIQLNNAAKGLQSGFRGHEPAISFKAMVNTMQSCNSCHEKYMEPALILPIPQPPQEKH